MSTDTQLRGDSRRRQLESSAQYAEQHGLLLVTENLLEDIGVSAFKGANLESGAAFGAFLTDVKTGRVPPGSFLLVESLDRLSRQNVLTSLSLFTDLINNGITIVTLMDGQVYSRDRTDFSQLVVSLAIMSRAHEESETKSRRLAAAWSNKREKAGDLKLTALAPAWLKLSPDRRSFEIDEMRASVVRSIFEDSAAGVGSYAITRQLNERGIAPFGRSSGWQTSYVKKILANKAVLGEFQPHRLVNGKRLPSGDAISDYYPRIVDDAVFNRAQLARLQRQTGAGGRKGSAVSNLFSGIARCAYCGGPMHIINKGRGRKGGRYLICDEARRGLGCHRKGWQYEEFESSFLAFVTEVDLNAIVLSDADAAKRRHLTEQVEAKEGEINRLRQQRDRAFRLLIEEDQIATDFVKQELSKLDTSIQVSEVELKKLNEDRTRLEADDKLFRVGNNEIKQLISALRSGKDGEKYLLRSQVSSRLRSIVSSLQVAVAGRTPFIERAVALTDPQDDLLADVRSALIEDQSSPRSSRRYFSVMFKDGRMRIVLPDSRDSLQALESIYQREDGFVTVGEDGGERLFLPAVVSASREGR